MNQTSQDFHVSCLRGLPIMAFALDDGFTLTEVSDELVRVTGRTRESLIGQAHSVLFEAGNEDTLAALTHHLTTSGSAHEDQGLRLTLTLGEPMDVAVSARTYGHKGTDFDRALFFLTDIQRSRRLEQSLQQSLQQSKERLEEVTTHMRDLVAVVDTTLRFEWVSPSSFQLFGFPPEAFKGRSIYDFLHPDDARRIKRLETEFLSQRKSEPVECRHVRADGSHIWLEITISFVTEEDGSRRYLILNSRDITERKQNKQALEESESRYRALFEFVGDAVLLMEKGRIVTANAQAEALFDLSRHELSGMTPFDLSPTVQPDGEASAEKGLSYYQAAVDGRRQIFEWRHRNKDGKELDTEVTLNRVPGRNDETVIASIRDMTRNKQIQAERHAIERRMLQAQKMESLGVLAGGIAHDFNNFLMGIMGNASLALLEISESSQAGESVNAIMKAAQRSADLCKQLLAYSGKGKFAIEPINLSDVILDMGHLLKAGIGKNVQLEYRLAVDLPPVEGDVTQLRQVLMNLITNASEAIGPNNGTITLINGIVQGNEPWVLSLNHGLPLRDGPYIFLEVRDNGCGMAADQLEKIFDPFYSTKFLGRGLGLAAVLGIVRGHDGVLNVQSEEGKGSSFTLFLKAARHHSSFAKPKQQDATVSPHIMGNGTVLVVDDEPLVRAVTAKILRGAGYDVLLAEDGEEAVERYIGYRDDICAVLLDMSMPKLSGEAVFAQLRELDADVRVILSSGYAEEEARKRFGENQPSSFLQKPYRPKDVLLALESIRKEI